LSPLLKIQVNTMAASNVDMSLDEFIKAKKIRPNRGGGRGGRGGRGRGRGGRGAGRGAGRGGIQKKRGASQNRGG